MEVRGNISRPLDISKIPTCKYPSRTIHRDRANPTFISPIPFLLPCTHTHTHLPPFSALLSPSLSRLTHTHTKEDTELQITIVHTHPVSVSFSVFYSVYCTFILCLLFLYELPFCTSLTRIFSFIYFLYLLRACFLPPPYGISLTLSLSLSFSVSPPPSSSLSQETRKMCCSIFSGAPGRDNFPSDISPSISISEEAAISLTG